MARTPTPKPKPTPKKSEAVKTQETIKQKPKELKGKAAIDAYQKEISPEGVRKAEEIARKALEKKYPGMFIPKKRTNTLIPGR